MKSIFIIIALLIAFHQLTLSQNDTIVFLSIHGEPVFNKNESYEYFTIKNKGESLFELKRLYLVDSVWYDQKFTCKKVNDSTYQIWNILYNNWDTRNVKICTGGYWIYDIQDGSISSGISKMIFPLLKEGTWTYYEDSLKFLEEYYQNNKLIGNKYWNDDGTLYYSDVFLHPDTPISFKIGGPEGLSNWITANIQYPEEAIKNGDYGKVSVQVVITKEGTIDGIKIISGVCSSLNDEAIRVISTIPNEFIPATIDGKPVNVLRLIPINFKLK